MVKEVWQQGGLATKDSSDQHCFVSLEEVLSDVFAQVQNEKVYVQIVRQVKQLIAEGKLKPGERLPPERVLAERFGTSRPSIREALAALEIMGLIECKTGVGSVVRAACTADLGESTAFGSDSSPYEIMEARLVIEPSIAKLAASRRTDDDVQRLTECIRQMGEATARQDYAGYNRADADFHRAILDATHNDLLCKVGAGLVASMHENLWQALKIRSLQLEGRMARYTSEHKQILDTISVCDAESVVKLVYDHIRGVESDVF